ncbi:F-box and associated interaction domains-containing protein [Prunus dulcis]|uniref:F-box and associated interaction domains-containing protein n=1 Tax=Prunus dulcis TaxID=3755 RepID=A0A4Y1RDS6_PRUDU|nr:F-box and associated interaction domains-containing protein [Prunus dulcis]
MEVHDHKPSFIHAHLNPTVDFDNQNDIDLLLLHRISGSNSLNYYQNTVINKVKDEVHSVHHDNRAFDVYSKIEFPISAKKNYGNSHLRVVGTCDGLICLADDVPSYAYNFIIWNPAIKKSVTLPRPGITYQTHGGYDASIGFGFDASTNDYKVVRVVTLMDDDDETPTLAEVYSLATGTWTSLGCVSPACLIDKAASSAFVNGVLHWPVVCQTDVDFYYIILTFDLGKEVFSQIPMPKIIQLDVNLGLQLSVSDDKKSIALFMRPNNREDFYVDYGREDSVLDIWVMKEYGREESWTKLITLNPQGRVGNTVTAQRKREAGTSITRPCERTRASSYSTRAMQSLTKRKNSNVVCRKCLTCLMPDVHQRPFLVIYLADFGTLHHI